MPGHDACSDLSFRPFVRERRKRLNGLDQALPERCQAVTGTGRQVREYRLTPAGRRQLDAELNEYRRVSSAIGTVIEDA